jgi:hypothetical protein
MSRLRIDDIVSSVASEIEQNPLINSSYIPSAGMNLSSERESFPSMSFSRPFVLPSQDLASSLSALSTKIDILSEKFTSVDLLLSASKTVSEEFQYVHFVVIPFDLLRETT